MERPRILILTAIQMEAAAIARQFGVRAPRGPDPTNLPCNGASVELHVIGVGAKRLPALAAAHPTSIIMAGLGGGLYPAFSVGDVLIDDASTLPLPGLANPRARFHTTTAVTGAVQDKSTLRGQTAAAVVDMESAPIRALAAQYNIPYLGLRAISDSANDAIDPAVLRFVDPFGSPRIFALMTGLARRPTLIPQLLRLSRASKLALSALAPAVHHAVQILTTP